MSGWKDELAGLAEAGERQASPPEPNDMRRRVRRRRVARAALPVAATVVVLMAGVVLIPQLFRQPLAGPAEQPAEVCGLPVQEAAAAAFDVEQAVGPGDGLAEVSAGANQVVEHGAGFAIGVGVKYGASGVDELALVPAGETYVVAWLVGHGEVVGVLEPELVGSPESNVQPGAEVWLDGSYRPQACDGGPADVGEYAIVAAVALAPVLGGGDPGTATAVLSEPIPLRISEADPLARLGACGSAWPDGVAETTDGYQLGLRLEAGASGMQVEDEAARVVVTTRNEGPQQLEGWTGHPLLVVVANGVVIGGTDGMDDVGIDATLAPGASLDYDGYTPLTDCESRTGQLPAGTYEVYAIMSFFFESPAGQDGPEGTRTDVTAVGAPWELVLD